MKHFNRHIRPYLILLLVALLAYWPVAAFIHPLKYDLIDQAYPWKFFIGECLQNQLLPLWNPYQLLGSPIHADPQSSAWYPVVWLTGYFAGYNIYTVSLDFMLHIFLAGAGMYFLARTLRMGTNTALAAGISYMLCGFFTGNAQHFMWIISGTWIPFLIAVYINISEQRKVRHVLAFVLLMFLFVTGGYPAFIILTGYLLAILFLYYAVGMIRKKQYPALRTYLLLNLLAILLTAIVTSVVLISVYHLMPAMTRGDGVLLRQALFGPFPPKSFVSFLFPFATVLNPAFYGTDISMANGYFGLVMLAFFLLALAIRKPVKIWIFLGWGLLMLGIAAGDALPLRAFLYHHVPFMDMFRFPALFRIFALICFIITGAYAFREFIENPGRYIWALRLITLLMLAGVVTAILLANPGEGFSPVRFMQEKTGIFARDTTIARHIYFQGMIQGILLLLMLATLFFARRKIPLLLLIAIADLSLATRLNGPYTVYYPEFRSADVMEHSTSFPSGFPLPAPEPVLHNNDRSGINEGPLWKNLNIFHKQIAWDGYNPLHLDGFEYLADSLGPHFRNILQKPPVYLSYKTAPVDSMAAHQRAGHPDPGLLYLEEGAMGPEHSPDSRQRSGDTVIYRHFDPTRFVVEARVSHPAWITLQQNNYYGWKATVDGKPARIYTSSHTLISVPLPRGTHEVSFYYEPADVILGFRISLAGLVIVLAWWLWLVLFVPCSSYVRKLF